MSTTNPDGTPVVPIHPGSAAPPPPEVEQDVQAAIDHAVNSLRAELLAPESILLKWDPTQGPEEP